MRCPDCNTEYVCPCDSCRTREPGKVPWIRTNKENGEFDETCPQCGLTKDVNEWMDIEYEQYAKPRKDK